MKLNGALLAGLIAGLFPLFLSFIFLRDVIFIKTNPVPQNSSKIFKEMLIYAIPVFLTYIGVTFLTNMDMIMVKHYFTAAETGTYSAAVVIGRIAYFLPATIVAVLFPVVSAEHARRAPFNFIPITPTSSNPMKNLSDAKEAMDKL